MTNPVPTALDPVQPRTTPEEIAMREIPSYVQLAGEVTMVGKDNQ